MSPKTNLKQTALKTPFHFALKPLAMAVFSASLLVGCGGGSSSDGEPNSDPKTTAPITQEQQISSMQKVLITNANIAYAAYSDSVETTENLLTAIQTFRKDPTQANLDAAKQAWVMAREPYGQTEVYRFRLSPIDSTDYENEDGPEGDINAWPLGEALIDYVQTNTTDFGADQVGVTSHATAVNGGGSITGNEQPQDNIIANTAIEINANLLSNTATAEDEHDVIAGYHAIEFLLWGQDLNNQGQTTDSTDRDQAVKVATANNFAAGGQRPLSDFGDGYITDDQYDPSDLGDRRLKYLEVATEKLIADLKQVRDSWAVGANYRTAFTSIETLEQGKAKFAEILTGMGTLSEGELAGERMQIALSANSQEDEHSCFSDNTHRDIATNAQGVWNSYYGDYLGYDTNGDGTIDANDNTNRKVEGYGFDDYLADMQQAALVDLGSELETALAQTQTHVNAIDSAAKAGKPVDVLIMNPMSEDAKPMRDAILSLNTQSAKIAQLANALEINATVVDPDASACDTTNPTAECP